MKKPKWAYWLYERKFFMKELPISAINTITKKKNTVNDIITGFKKL